MAYCPEEDTVELPDVAAENDAALLPGATNLPGLCKRV